MGTYIINFDDKPWKDLDDEQYYRCSEIPWFSTTKTSLHRLIPYTEPDLDAVRKEAYAEGYKEGMQLSIDDAKLKEEYRCGLNDAWEAARKLWEYDTTTLKKIFGEGVMRMDFFMKFEAFEAIEKIRQYKQEKEEQIQVGDEVKSIERGWKAVVVRISDDNSLTLMDSNGAIADDYNITMFVKTGRHFPEIAEVLAKMKEETGGY